MHRPPIVRRFLRAIAQSDLMCSFPETTQRVLFYLCSLVDKDGQNIELIARRETIAAATNLTEISVYRALQRLEHAGCIIRDGQRFIGSGERRRFSFSPILLGNSILNVYRNILASDYSSKQHLSDIRYFNGLSENGTPSDLTAIPRLSDRKTLKRNTNGEVKESNERPSGIRLPGDLEYLVDSHGLTPNQVVRLMKYAKDHGKQLQDILTMKSKPIGNGLVHNLFGYLKHLILSDETDFGWLAKQWRQQTAAKAGEAQMNADLSTLQAQLKGQVLQDEKGTHYEIEETGSGVFVRIQRPGDRHPRCAPFTEFAKTLARLIGFPLTVPAEPRF
jgi:hypothetical protein